MGHLDYNPHEDRNTSLGFITLFVAIFAVGFVFSGSNEQPIEATEKCMQQTTVFTSYSWHDLNKVLNRFMQEHNVVGFDVENTGDNVAVYIWHCD